MRNYRNRNYGYGYRPRYSSTGYVKRNRQRNYSYKGNTYIDYAKKALKVATYVAGLVNAETKYSTYDVVGTAVTNTGSILELFNPPQGVGADQREGDSVKTKNITIRGNIYNGAIAGANTIVRTIYFIDKENNITSAADLLQLTGTANAPFSEKNENNKYDTKILYDKTYTTSTYTPIKTFDDVIQLDAHVHFEAGTTTVDNNAIKVCIISDTAGAVYSLHSRVTYMDN